MRIAAMAIIILVFSLMTLILRFNLGFGLYSKKFSYLCTERKKFALLKKRQSVIFTIAGMSCMLVVLSGGRWDSISTVIQFVTLGGVIIIAGIWSAIRLVRELK